MRRHKWKPNEAYFLQAIGDQMLMSVSHTRLRSLVRRMGVSDERTGLLSRSSYQSCLLTEADRARTQGTPLALAILQIDRGAEILRQQGESPVERFLEQLARSLQPIVRQNDVAVKYTSWSLAFILPDTTLEGAQNLADKLRTRGFGFAAAVGLDADHAERGDCGSGGEAGVRERRYCDGLDQSRGDFARKRRGRRAGIRL